jgi:DNA-binding CsgD family transcriptional regulator
MTETRDIFGLTTSQAEFLRLLPTGMPRKAIASKLAMSEKTLEYHISGKGNRGSIYNVLHLTNNAEMVRFAMEHGIAAKRIPETNGELTSIPRFSTIGDLAQALLRGAALASVGKADVLQVNALCQCTTAIINLSRLQMEVRERKLDVGWLEDKSK